MLKITGLILIVAAFTGTGFLGAERIKNRYLRLKNICLFIEEAADRIRTGQELFGIIDSLGQKAGIYIEEHSIKADRKWLCDEDVGLLEGFMSELGFGDTQSQLKRCEVYLLLMRKSESSAHADMKLKNSLYGKLGFFAGLFAAIMLV